MPASRHYCRICHYPIPHAGAECPHCRKRRSPFTPSALTLPAVFFAMAALYAGTALLTGSYREVRAARRQVHVEAAEAMVEAGSYREAVEEYRNALGYARDDFAARLGLAQALYHLGRSAEARQHLIDLRAVDPTHAVVNRLLGEVAAAEGNVDEAASYLRTAIYGRWPEDPDANRLRVRLELADLLEASGDRLEAVGELVEASKEAPGDPSLQKRIGWLLVEGGAPAKAVAAFEEVIRAQPRDAEAFRGLGEAEFARGHYLSARTAFSRALSRDASDSAAYDRLRLCNRIVDLDPTYRRAGTRERYRRSVELVERVLAELRRCEGHGSPAAGLADEETDELRTLVESAEGALTRRVPPARSEEAVEENISLAESLWLRRLAACPSLEPADEALAHVVARLAE